MGAIKGLLSTEAAATNELVGEFQETIFVRNSRGHNVGTSLFGLMSRLDNEAAENLEYNWFERDPIKKTIYSDSVTSTTATSVQFRETSGGANGGGNAYLVDGTVLMCDSTGEFVRVTTAPNDTTTACTVVRGMGGTPVAFVTNSVWTIVTVGKTEGADPTKARYENPSTITNYIQTYNSVAELTNAFKGSVLRTDIDGPLTDRRIVALEQISRDIEFSYFLGQRANLSTGTGVTNYTGGILDSLTRYGSSSQILAGTGVTAITTFNNWLQSFMSYGSEAKLAFAGPQAFSAISYYANSQSNGYRIMQNETVFGMNINVINTPFGELNLTQHPLFREAAGLNGWMFVVDLPMVTQKVFEKLFLEPNVQTPGSDSYKEQFRAKLGLKLKFPQAFGVAKNVTSIT